MESLAGVKSISIIADGQVNMTVGVLEGYSGIQAIGMLNNIEERLANCLELKYAKRVFEPGRNAIRLHADVQTILVVHLFGQPVEGVDHTVALQNGRAEIDAQVAGNGNRLVQRLLQLRNIIIDGC